MDTILLVGSYHPIRRRSDCRQVGSPCSGDCWLSDHHTRLNRAVLRPSSDIRLYPIRHVYRELTPADRAYPTLIHALPYGRRV